jgi:hypothetical protein
MDAVACELGIRCPTLQSIYAGKLNKQSIQVNIIYDIMFCIMISYLISWMINRCRDEKRMLEQQTTIHTTTMLARSAWMCIFSSQPGWMSFQSSQMSFVQMMASWQSNSGLSIRFANPILVSAGCLQSLPHGLVRILAGAAESVQIPPKRDVEWTAGELNAIMILENNLVPNHGGKGSR